MKERSASMLAFSGFNGIGKSYKMDWIAKRYRAQVMLSVMTRDPRLYEVEGVHGFFKSDPEYDEMVKADQFVTNFEVMGRRYGIPTSEVERIRRVGDVPMVAMEARTVGALRVRYPEVIGVFLEPVHHRIAVNRMYERGDSDEDVDRRIPRSLLEIEDFYCNKTVRSNFQLHLRVDGTEENFYHNVNQIVDLSRLVPR